MVSVNVTYVFDIDNGPLLATLLDPVEDVFESFELILLDGE